MTLLWILENWEKEKMLNLLVVVVLTGFSKAAVLKNKEEQKAIINLSRF